VTVKASSDNGHVTIQVSDTGIGISEQDMPHVFDPFFRVYHGPPQGVEGTGLGLSIVKTIVEQHGGTICVESKPGRGSTFSITLPLKQPPPPEAQDGSK
jgi:signal transduction histidine kinase